ncbi:hypothetical protein HY989_02800 [Candidatus Micrarchaeota archaeon]|nr:hypothetical protein [Candidatus Micrarchaeota archaeon]
MPKFQNEELFGSRYKEAVKKKLEISKIPDKMHLRRSLKRLDEWAQEKLDFREHLVLRLYDPNRYFHDVPFIEAIKLIEDEGMRLPNLIHPKNPPYISGNIGKLQVTINSPHAIHISLGKNRTHAEISDITSAFPSIKFSGPKNMRFIRQVYAFKDRIFDPPEKSVFRKAIDKIRKLGKK